MKNREDIEEKDDAIDKAIAEPLKVIQEIKAELKVFRGDPFENASTDSDSDDTPLSEA